MIYIIPPKALSLSNIKGIMLRRKLSRVTNFRAAHFRFYQP